MPKGDEDKMMNLENKMTVKVPKVNSAMRLYYKINVTRSIIYVENFIIVSQGHSHVLQK